MSPDSLQAVLITKNMVQWYMTCHISPPAIDFICVQDCRTRIFQLEYSIATGVETQPAARTDCRRCDTRRTGGTALQRRRAAGSRSARKAWASSAGERWGASKLKVV